MTSPLPVPGMPFLNRLLKGGFLPGTVTGLVGPTGGGKTMLAAQIAGALSYAGHQTVYFCMEQDNEPVRRLNEQLFGTLPELKDQTSGILRRAMSKQRARHLRLTEDLFHLDGSEIASFSIKGNTNPELIIIDQLGTWIMRNEKLLTQWTIADTCNILKGVARELHVPILLLHQTKGEAKALPPPRRPGMSDAANSTAFAESDVNHCLFIGTQQDDGCCWLSNPRQALHEPVWMDGDHQQFFGLGSPESLIGIDRTHTLFECTSRAANLGVDSAERVGRMLKGTLPCSPPESERPCRSREFPDPPIHLSLFLSAAAYIAGRMTAEDALKTAGIVFRSDDSEFQDAGPMNFALWCRCTGRMDFQHLLHAASLADVDLSLPEEECRSFCRETLQQASECGWDGREFTPPFIRKGSIVSSPPEFVDLFSATLADQLRHTIEYLRSRNAWEADSRLKRCRAEAVSYGSKHLAGNYWIDRLRLFIEADVSPFAFLEQVYRYCGMVPWGASLPTLLEQIPHPPIETTLLIPHFCSSRKITDCLREEELEPWQIALLALQAGTLHPEALGFVAPLYWIQLAWHCIGHPAIAEQTGKSLSGLLPPR